MATKRLHTRTILQFVELLLKILINAMEHSKQNHSYFKRNGNIDFYSLSTIKTNLRGYNNHTLIFQIASFHL